MNKSELYTVDKDHVDDVLTLSYASQGTAHTLKRGQLTLKPTIGLALIVSAMTLLLLFVTPEFVSHDPNAKVSLTKRLVGPKGELHCRIETYRTHVGQLPTTLRDLMYRPEAESMAPHWQGPYIKDLDQLDDPWGSPLKYYVSEHHAPPGFTLWSVGLDKTSHTEDDIHNYKCEQ